MVNEQMRKCNKCNVVKPFALMRKNKSGKDGILPTCNACAAEVKAARRALLKQITPKFVKEEYVPKYTYQPYVPEKHWVRNNGNTHIPSRGFQC